ncbi:hypothetical protein [Rhodocaloribacter sp.]
MFRRRRRRIVWDEYVKRQVLALIDDYPRLYDVMRNFEWLLEKQPANNFAEQIDETFWLIKSDDLYLPHRAGIPQVTLIYRFDDTTVTFFDIRIVTQ